MGATAPVNPNIPDQYCRDSWGREP